MEYKNLDLNEYIKKLKNFKQKEWVQKHIELMKKPNFWTILEYGKTSTKNKRSSHEIRTSRMIRWLLDPNETHNLGNIFAKKLIDLINKDYEYSPNKNKDIKVTAEYEDIDVFYRDLSQNICLAIEVKQYAKESISKGYKSQLDKYIDIVEKWKKKGNKDVQDFYIYLTPLRKEPSNHTWNPVGYEEFIKIIDEVINEYLIKSEVPYKKDTLKIMTDFKDDLQRTLYNLQKDALEISESLLENEKKITLDLATDIEQGNDSEYLKILINECGEDIKDIILIIKDYLYAQNHTQNIEVGLLIRKMYNYLSGDNKLEEDRVIHHSAKKTITPIKQEIIDKYGIDFVEVHITSGKGQGLYLLHKDKKHRIYLSGDTHGDFPNDRVQLKKKNEQDQDEIINISQVVKTGDFIVDEKIFEDKVLHDKTETILSIKTLMENYILQAVKELNDKIGMNK